MWCYQKPGFEALLLAELQKQQQSSQFCDTVLKADGVSVPAHSCIISAISPQFSSSLSSSLAAAEGQKRLLEFGALDACTLLHLVRLLYSGKMSGEGEKEKQEAISAAAKLGIHGLVEVSNIDSQQRKPRDECLYIEVGVQTESQISEEHQVRLGGWRREVRDGATVLWREKLPTRGTEMSTQTDNLELNTQPSVSYETIDLNVLQSLGQTEPLQIPYVPMSTVYPNEDNHRPGQSTVSSAGHYSSFQTNVFPLPSQATPFAVDTLQTSHWSSEIGRTTVLEEWPEEGFEQFEGNIPGFINYFLNPEKDECSNRRRGRRRAGVGGTWPVRTRSRGRPRGRRAGLTETVGVQEVGVSKLSKVYLQRWGMYAHRTGQGGGAAGRMLYVKTREFVRSGRCRQRKGRGTEWNADQCATMLVKADPGPRRPRGRPRGRGNRKQQPRAQRVTRAPPARGPEEQPEQIDNLLEEVMMGLDILSNNKNAQVHSSTCRRPVQSKRRQTSALKVTSISEVPVLQQPQEGELTDILDQFLESFERLECEAAQNSTQSIQPHTDVTEYRKNNVEHPIRNLQPGTSTQSETIGNNNPMKNPSRKASSSVRRRRRKREYPLSMQKPRTKLKKITLSEALKREEVKLQATRQLQQIPVVKLERRRALPESVRIQELSQNPVPRAKRSPSVTLLPATKTYPIRSRFKEAQVLNSNPFFEEPLSDKGHRGKRPKNGALPFVSRGGSSLSRAEKLMENEVENGPDSRETNTRVRKRCLDSDESNREVKRMWLNPPESSSQTRDAAEVIDIETVSLNCTDNTVPIANSESVESVEREVDAAEGASDADAESNDIIDVDSGFSDLTSMVHAEVKCSLRADLKTKTSDAEDLDDEVDVTGGSSPAPAPVLISWTDSSEDEGDDSEMDPPEENTVVLTKGQLVRC